MGQINCPLVEFGGPWIISDLPKILRGGGLELPLWFRRLCFFLQSSVLVGAQRPCLRVQNKRKWTVINSAKFFPPLALFETPEKQNVFKFQFTCFSAIVAFILWFCISLSSSVVRGPCFFTNNLVSFRTFGGHPPFPGDFFATSYSKAALERTI